MESGLKMIIKIWKMNEKEPVVLEEYVPKDTRFRIREVITDNFKERALVFLNKVIVPYKNDLVEYYKNVTNNRISQYPSIASLDTVTENDTIDVIEISYGMFLNKTVELGRVPLEYTVFFDEDGNRK